MAQKPVATVRDNSTEQSHGIIPALISHISSAPRGFDIRKCIGFFLLFIAAIIAAPALYTAQTATSYTFTTFNVPGIPTVAQGINAAGISIVPNFISRRLGMISALKLRIRRNVMKRSAIIGLAIFGAIAILTAAPAEAQKLAVTTYHYDNQRTGWNQQETTLTPANVGPTSFGVIAQVVLDDQVDAQPLLVPGQPITAGLTPGTYQVVYVATESNTIYAIRASTGAVLLQRNLGAPVPMPLNCNNNGPNVGITSTPVIDVATHALYVVA
jgi:hypothetical protein